MILNREEFTYTLLALTGLVFLLACCVGIVACLWSQFRCKRGKNRNRSASNHQATTSSSYNPLLQSSKSDPISLDIEYIDDAAVEQPVSPAVKIRSLHGAAP